MARSSGSVTLTASPAVGGPRALARWGRWVLGAIPLGFLGVFFLWPVIALVHRAVSVAGTEDSVSTMLARTHAWTLLGVTLAQAAASTVITLAIAAPMVWLYARSSERAVIVLTIIVTVPFVLPTVVVGVAFRALLNGPLAGLGVGSGWPAVLAAHAFLNAAV